jgi:lysophospholipase L1-like esterase
MAAPLDPNEFIYRKDIVKLLASPLLFLTAGLFGPLLGQAQLVPEFTQPRSPECCPTIAAQAFAARAQAVAMQARDWAEIGYYHAENAKLQAEPAPSGRVVFIGDAITEPWDLAHYFPGKPYVNRGIPGQTTPQMLVRFYPDVIALHPAAVVILGGINDIAGNTGQETAEMIEDNIRAMCQLAEANAIKVILGLILPVSDYTAHKQTEKHPHADIVKLNTWLRSYATEIHAEVADYYSAVADSEGMLKEGYSEDGAHANDRSYSVMAPVAEAAIERALK